LFNIRANVGKVTIDIRPPNALSAPGLVIPTKGSLGCWTLTGDPKAFELSLNTLRQKSPNVKVFLSVGGATYQFPSTGIAEDKIEGIVKYID